MGVSTLINSAQSLFSHNAGDPVSKSSVFRLRRPLVVDELDLDRLHRRHGEDGLADSGAEATEQPKIGKKRA